MATDVLFSRLPALLLASLRMRSLLAKLVSMSPSQCRFRCSRLRATRRASVVTSTFTAGPEFISLLSLKPSQATGPTSRRISVGLPCQLLEASLKLPRGPRQASTYASAVVPLPPYCECPATKRRSMNYMNRLLLDCIYLHYFRRYKTCSVRRKETYEQTSQKQNGFARLQLITSRVSKSFCGSKHGYCQRQQAARRACVLQLRALLVKSTKKVLLLFDYACHSCSETMLIFSV
jgi:hypothetical protein